MRLFAHKYLLFAIVCVVAISCEKAIVPEQELEVESRSYTMRFDGRVDGYDGLVLRTSDTKALEQWEEGDMLHIAFTRSEIYNDGSIITATYSSRDNKWSFDMRSQGLSDLLQNISSCKVYYFENNESDGYYNSKQVNLYTPIYTDDNATCALGEDNELIVTAILKPKLARVRFKGKYVSDAHMMIKGINVYSAISLFSGELTTDNAIVDTNVDKDGYTPYIYCTIDEARRIYLRMSADSSSTYTLECDDKSFVPGKSGYITLPEEGKTNRWRMGLHFRVMGIDFSLLAISSGSSRYVGQTEVTEELYQTVMGNQSNSQLPQTNITRTQAIEFANRLRQELPFSFRLPSMNDWASASMYNLYFSAGRGTLYLDYAWCASNSSSLQPVMQKYPNPSGFYDMIGNASEWLEDQINYKYCYAGGSYLSDSDFFSDPYNYTTSNSYKAEDLGFRLATNFMY